MPGGKFHKLRQARHRPVLVQHFTDHGRRLRPDQPRDIDPRLGMARPFQHALVAGADGEDMPRYRDIRGAAGGIDCDRDGPRAVRGGNAGGDAVTRLDR